MVIRVSTSFLLALLRAGASERPLIAMFHHLAHSVAVVGVALLWRPFLGQSRLLHPVSHTVVGEVTTILERNTPAFF